MEAGGVELVVQLGVDQVDLAQVGLGRVAGDAERCFTVSPACASPSIPRPAIRRMESAGDLLKLWVGLRWTARTVGEGTITRWYGWKMKSLLLSPHAHECPQSASAASGVNLVVAAS